MSHAEGNTVNFFVRGGTVSFVLACCEVLPFGNGKHFVQLAGGTNGHTAPKLRKLGIIGRDAVVGQVMVVINHRGRRWCEGVRVDNECPR